MLSLLKRQTHLAVGEHAAADTLQHSVYSRLAHCGEHVRLAARLVEHGVELERFVVQAKSDVGGGRDTLRRLGLCGRAHADTHLDTGLHGERRRSLTTVSNDLRERMTR